MYGSDANIKKKRFAGVNAFDVYENKTLRCNSHLQTECSGFLLLHTLHVTARHGPPSQIK